MQAPVKLFVSQTRSRRALSPAHAYNSGSKSAPDHLTLDVGTAAAQVCQAIGQKSVTQRHTMITVAGASRFSGWLVCGFAWFKHQARPVEGLDTANFYRVSGPCHHQSMLNVLVFVCNTFAISQTSRNAAADKAMGPQAQQPDIQSSMTRSSSVSQRRS